MKSLESTMSYILGLLTPALADFAAKAVVRREKPPSQAAHDLAMAEAIDEIQKRSDRLRAAETRLIKELILDPSKMEDFLSFLEKEKTPS